MKTIKDINKLIVKKIIEIMFVVCFVFFATYLWRSKQAQSFFASISTFRDLSYTNMNIENPIGYSMFPMSDDFAMQNLKPCTISVFNGTYTPEYYILVLKIDKNSTLDFTYLNIGVNQEVFSLNELNRKDDNDYYIFVLDQDTIVGETKEYKVRVWLNTLAENDMQAKELIMEFDLMNESIPV